MKRVLAILVLFVLVGCGGPTITKYGTVVGYDETTGTHHADISLFDKPAGAPPPYRTVGYAHEGQQVGIIEQHDDGTIKVRTPDGIEGWTQIDFVTNIH